MRQIVDNSVNSEHNSFAYCQCAILKLQLRCNRSWCCRNFNLEKSRCSHTNVLLTLNRGIWSGSADIMNDLLGRLISNLLYWMVSRLQVLTSITPLYYVCTEGVISLINLVANSECRFFFFFFFNSLKSKVSCFFQVRHCFN